MTLPRLNFRQQIVFGWKQIPYAWRISMLAILLARVVLTLWSLVVLTYIPQALQNLDLFGEPVVTVFDVQSSGRYVYNRTVDGQLLMFQPFKTEYISDVQTGSRWELTTGKALEGPLTGRQLMPAKTSVEQVFPYKGVQPASLPLLAIWQRFDTNWYLKIAQGGYANDGSTAFFPLFPLLMRMFGWISGGEFFAGILISSLALVVACFYLYTITSELFDIRTAKRSILYLMVFPTAFFLSAAYTESLFLCLSLACFYYARHAKWLIAILCGVFASLTRLQGPILFAPLVYIWWNQRPRSGIYTFWGICALPFTTALFLWSNSVSLKESLETTWHARWVFPWENFFVFFEMMAKGGISSIDILNMLVVILFGGICYFCWHSLPREFFIYTLLMTSVPLFRLNEAQPFVSMIRYVLVVFPAFIFLAKAGKNSAINRVLIYIGLCLELYLSAQFFLWGWVA